jgi:molecular chaperone DnaK
MHVGIDLGTTFSLIARVDAHGTPVVFPDLREAERFKTPSVVHLGPDGALVGQPVEELLEEAPALPVVRFVKLQMGNTEPVLVDAQGQAWLPEGIAALIVLKLLRDVRAYTDEPIESAIITVPAHFSDLQRRATWHAGQLAGLNVVDLVEEPLAAATHYGAHTVPPDSTLLVYDLGGGTFDATVLRAGKDGLDALATEGVSDLGGKNFDEAVMGLIAEQFRTAHHYDPLGDPVAAGQLRRQAEAIKIKLSSPGRGEVRTSLLLGGRAQEVILTRGQFERLTAPLIERSLTVCAATLKAAGLGWEAIDQVLLAGGSTLLPAVEAALRRASGKSGDRLKRQQPHMAVAYGAALLAAQRAGAPTGAAPRLRQRITGVDLGFRVFDPVRRAATIDVVIARNTPIPVRKTTTYYSNRADQKRVIVEVVQGRGEGGAAASLGHCAFLLERPRKNHPLEVILGYDEHGLVTVIARDPDTGQEVKRAFDGPGAQNTGPPLSQRDLLSRVRLCE